MKIKLAVRHVPENFNWVAFFVDYPNEQGVVIGDTGTFKHLSPKTWSSRLLPTDKYIMLEVGNEDHTSY